MIAGDKRHWFVQIESASNFFSVAPNIAIGMPLREQRTLQRSRPPRPKANTAGESNQELCQGLGSTGASALAGSTQLGPDYGFMISRYSPVALGRLAGTFRFTAV
jgi:hypothetical protein